MRCLLDTNIFLEMILEREKSDEAQKLLSCNQEHEFFLSNYSLHSIATYLINRKFVNVFDDFLTDQILQPYVGVLSLTENELKKVLQVTSEQNLDFDDAYQYTVAEKHDLTIVSFDKDFDKTNRGRKTPAQILNS